MGAFRRWLVGQFSWPRGVAGSFAGRIMASRPSNRVRNRETIRLLGIGPDDTVLEIGCGPGLGIEEARRLATCGAVTGLDRSRTMLKQAARRLRRTRLADRVALIEGDASVAISLAPAATRIFGVNVAQFISERAIFIKNLAGGMPPGGRLALTYQPRDAHPTRASAEAMAKTLDAEMREAGLTVTIHEIGLKPVPAFCVIGEAKGL